MLVFDGLSLKTTYNTASSFLITYCILFNASLHIAFAQQLYETDNDNKDDLYILIDEISVYTCRGVKNEIKVTEDDINIVNEKGNRVYYVKAPGNYSLHFKNLLVTRDMGYLSGEIGVTLQVPVIEGPAGIRFDLPYTIVPETGLLDQRCDEHSGIVQHDGRHYCRYCDVCGLTEELEKDLNNKGHLFLPEVARGNEKKFSPICNRISTNVYEFNRTINLPGRRELESRVAEKLQTLDGESRQRLNKRRGRFQVFLNLISAKQPPIKQHEWFSSSSECQCCWPNSSDSCHGILNFLYCNKEDCKSTWAQQCLHNSARIVACYTIEFNYRMTSSYHDVKVFLTENHYPNQEEVETTEPTLTSRNPSSITETVSGSITERCVANMPQKLTHLRRYCKIFWNAKLCCSHCSNVC
ncbi:unnamed protein product [Thelazia callipaeda]|uniref:ShKT domain-containing protein n=1 Tax=Thelazia callipaeda TaxID=103827 RepID=A0A0N5CLP6_THECL|nr:unnamed protein product [Thelazia callipaeda]